MRCYGFLVLTALMALTITATPVPGATFGSVVAIGGHAADMALDEPRGLLYIANFTANRIDVMSLADNTIHTSINVSPQPGSLALSRDGQYLLIAHFGATSPAVPSKNLLTLIRLTDNTRQTFITSDPPLGVAFFATLTATGTGFNGPGMALVVTTTGFFTLDPASGVMQVVSTLSNLAQTLPAAVVPTFPGQLLQTALSVSGDGNVVWGIGGAGTGTQVIYQYYASSGRLSVFTDVSAPPLLPRVSVDNDGATAMVGWVHLTAGGVAQSKYPAVVASTNVTGHVVDSKNGLIYGQIPDANQPLGPPYIPTGVTVGAGLPIMLIMDSDNLTVRDRILIPENMVGRTILNTAGNVIYAISDSGVMVLPVGSLNQAHRLSPDREDMLVQTNFCNRTSLAQPLTIVDPGGGHTSFTIASNTPGVVVSPSSGTTPATLQVVVDPSKFQTQGTTAVTLTLNSAGTVNIPNSVRVLINNPDQNQRGTVVDVPGVLTDVIADPSRNRFYVLRQDLNQLLIFDAATNQRIVALRTATTPTMMGMTVDQKYLLVGHDNSQYVTVYDLNSMQPVQPIVLPGGHYARSVAAANDTILALVRDEGTGTGAIDTLDFQLRRGTELPTLGIFANVVSTTGVLTAAPNGRSVLMAAPDGTVMLYSADASTFTVGRKDLKALSGAFAASSYDTYVIGNTVFNASLVPIGSMDSSLGLSSGFAFTGQGGYRVTAASQSTAGVIQNLSTLTSAQVNPIAMVEAPLLPTKTAAFTRTVAPMPSAGTVIALTTSGFTVLASTYASAVTPPAISSVQNAADGSKSVAPGGLISVYGSQMSAVNLATQQIPLPTAMGQSCLTVNGSPIPLLFVSSQQVNAQLPFNVAGNVTMSVHTPGGISNNYNFTIQSAAPAVFLSGTAGPETGLATIFRADNGQLVTPANPIHYNDTVVIYLTGMGPTTPSVDEGMATPGDLLTSVTQPPVLTLGGSRLSVLYAGLVPGYISGLYQINATVPGGVTQGMDIPLVISQGSGSTTLSVRVVK